MNIDRIYRNIPQVYNQSHAEKNNAINYSIISKVGDYNIIVIFKEFEIFLWIKRRFRLRWDLSPGFLIAVRTQLINLKLLT